MNTSADFSRSLQFRPGVRTDRHSLEEGRDEAISVCVGVGVGLHVPSHSGTSRRNPHRGSGARDWRRRLSLFLSAGDDGAHPAAAYQSAAGTGVARRADESLRQYSRLSICRHEGCRTTEFRHALLERLARSHQGAGRRVGARYGRALLPAADARHVDRRIRFARLADDRHRCRQFPRDAARLGRNRASRFRAHRRADALCLDHRPHQDRRTGRLRHRSQNSGRLQDHAALAMGQGTGRGGSEDRSRHRYEDAAEDTGRFHARRQIFHAGRRDPQTAAAACHGPTDYRAAEPPRFRSRQRLRS